MIRIDRVSKVFGNRRALDDVSLEVPRGAFVALLGHNGAGKSTLFALMLGLRRMTAGDITIGGTSVRTDPRAARRRVGSVLAPGFYEYLSGAENLRILTSYSGGVPAAEMRRVVRLVGLEERIADRVSTYSHGMRRRLALAQALLPLPEILLLDEWEAGLDPEAVRDFRNMLVDLHRDHGMTIVVSSHQPNGLEGVASRIAILRAGRLVLATPWDLRNGNVTAVRLALDDWTRTAAAFAAVGATAEGGDVVRLAAGGTVAALVAALVHAGVGVQAVEPVRDDLETLYLRMLPPDASATTTA